MLADSSSKIVSSGFPAGGGIGRTHVGFSSTTSAATIPHPIKAIAPITLVREIPPGRRRAYQIQSAAPPSASANHSEDGISGSKLISRPEQFQNQQFR